MLNIDTATVDELKQIPGVGDKIAQLIIQFREIYGVVKKEALILALRGNLPSDILDQIDFSEPRSSDPFDIDINCLPAVPKSNSWEPLVSFKTQMASRQASPHRSRSRTLPRQRSSRYDYVSSRSPSRSPAEERISQKQSTVKSEYAASRKARSGSCDSPPDEILKFYQEMSSLFERTMALLRKDIPGKDGKGSAKTGYTAMNEKKYDRSASRQIQSDKIEQLHLLKVQLIQLPV